MKNKYSKLKLLLLVTLTIFCFQNSINANTNPKKWASGKASTSEVDNRITLNPLNWLPGGKPNTEVIQLKKDQAKGVERLAKKLSKLKVPGKEKALQKIYKKILIKYPDATIAKEAAYNRGVYLFNEKKYEEAFHSLSNIKKYHPEYHKLGAAIKLQFKCAENLMHKIKKKTLGFKISPKYNTDSIPLFLAYSQLYPYNEKTPLALLLSAQVAQSDKEYDTAIISLKKLINEYPDSEFTADAYFLIAYIYSDFIKGPEYDLESTREAIRYCEDFIALYPKHENIRMIEVLYERMLNSLATNRVLMADYYYFNKRNNVAAIIFYNEAITISPKSQAAIEARERLDAIEMGIRPTTGQNFIKKLFFIK